MSTAQPSLSLNAKGTLITVLFFAEVPNDMVPKLIILAHDIKQKRVNIVIQRFVVQKQLRQIAQVLHRTQKHDIKRIVSVLKHSTCLTVLPLYCPINFKHRDASAAVNLIAWWVSNCHTRQVAQHFAAVAEESQVKLTEVKLEGGTDVRGAAATSVLPVETYTLLHAIWEVLLGKWREVPGLHHISS